MPSMTLRSVGAWVNTSGNDLIPPLPSPRGTGNLLLAAVAINDGSTAVPAGVAGWGDPLYAYTGNVRLALYARIATNDSADTWVGSSGVSVQKMACMACYTGDVLASVNSLLLAGNYRATSASSTAMDGGSLTVNSDNCLILTLARRQRSAVGSLSLGGAIVPDSNNYGLGTGQYAAWAYKQQTTKTDIAIGDIKWTILPGDDTAYGTHSVTVALVTNAGGTVYPQTISDTLVPSDDFIKSVSAGLAWGAVPAITSETGSSYTAQANRSATSVLYGVAVPRSSSPPSVAQIKAGQDGASQPACAVNTSTSGTGNVSLTLTLTPTYPFPLYDLHFALSNGTLDSDRQSILGPYLDPTTGHLFKGITSVGPTGSLAGTLAAPGDVWKTHRYTQATSYELTLLESADFQIAASGDTDRQQFSQWLYDYSARQWEGPGTVYVNNAPPDPGVGGAFPGGILWEQNSTLTPFDMVDEAPDPEADTVTVAKVAGEWPPGITMGGSPNYTVSGTPTAYGEWSVTIRWTDSLGEYYEETTAVVTGPKLPDVVGMTVAEAQAALSLASLTLVYDQEYHATVPAGDIISMVPNADTVVRYDAQVVLAVSLGPEP